MNAFPHKTDLIKYRKYNAISLVPQVFAFTSNVCGCGCGASVNDEYFSRDTLASISTVSGAYFFTCFMQTLGKRWDLNPWPTFSWTISNYVGTLTLTSAI